MSARQMYAFHRNSIGEARWLQQRFEEHRKDAKRLLAAEDFRFFDAMIDARVGEIQGHLDFCVANEDPIGAAEKALRDAERQLEEARTARHRGSADRKTADKLRADEDFASQLCRIRTEEHEAAVNAIGKTVSALNKIVVRARERSEHYLGGEALVYAVFRKCVIGTQFEPPSPRSPEEAAWMLFFAKTLPKYSEQQRVVFCEEDFETAMGMSLAKARALLAESLAASESAE